MNTTIRKKSILILATLSLSLGASAQSLEEGIRMVQYERYQKAREVLQPLAASNARANYYLGLAELESGNTEGARAIFVKYPQDPANMAGTARILIQTGKIAEGTAMAKTIADGAKKKEWEPIAFAADAINYGGGDAMTAVELYKKALERNDNVNLRIGLGDAYNRQPSGGGEAITNYERASRIDPKTSLGYSRQGILWYQAQTWDSALNNLNRAKALDEMNPIPYRELAKAYSRVNKFPQANENADRYYELSDKTTDDKIQRANIKFGVKDYAAAAAVGQELMQAGVTKPGLYRLQGWSAYELKDYPTAQSSLQTFFATEAPEKITEQDYRYMGRIYAATARWDSADFYFNKAFAMQKEGSKAEAYKEIAESYKTIKNDTAYARAGYWFGRAVEDLGAKASALDYYNWGFWSYYGKKYELAASTFETMETKFPDQPSATYWRGAVAAAQDPEAKTGGAVAHYEKWLGIADSDTYQKKKPQYMQAYPYLAFYYYNKNDKATATKYVGLIETIDPGNADAAKLRKAMAGTAKPAGGTTKPATGTKK